MSENICGNGGCGCSAGSTNGFEEKVVAKKVAKKEIDIEFLYLDLSSCEPCRGSESNLEEALRDVSLLLEKTGAVVNVEKIHVESYEQARALGFISSPTIRVNGHDVALEVMENYCSSCSDLSGTETFCRVWNFQGEQFSTVPKPLVVESVLREIYGAGTNESAPGTSSAQVEKSLANLKRFFEGRNAGGGNSSAAHREQINLPASTGKPAVSSGCGCS